MTQSEDAREFDDWADRYDESVRSRDDFPFHGYENVLSRVVNTAAAEPSNWILDLGIGTGNLAKHFVDLGCQVWGIDFSQEMLSQAKAKLPEVHLTQANLLDSWPKEISHRFDRIVSAYVFHHFDLAEKVKLLVRVGRDHCAVAGRIVVADISFPTSDALAQARIKWREYWDEEHYWVANEAILACEEAGFSVWYEQLVEFAGVFVFEPKPTLSTPVQ
jgi:putative AdoMet-dependent methyltransferase